MWRWTIVSVALLALLLSSCQQAAQKAVEQTTGVKTEQNGQAVTISNKEGTAVTFSSETPAELKDFPVPDGFTSDSSGSVASGEDKLMVAAWKGKSDYQTVSAFYKQAMAEKGWKSDFTMDTDTGGMQNWNKGDLSATITFDKPKDKDEMSISVLMGKGKPKTPTPEATDAEEPTETPEATPTEGPTETPAPPGAGDPSSLAAELKGIPVPSGFTLEKGSAIRMESDGKFQGATAAWYGVMSIKEASAFYKSQMTGKGWKEMMAMETDEGATLAYTSANDEKLSLAISISQKDAGTEISWVLTQGQ